MAQQSDILDLIRREGSLSRWQLHERTGLRANSVGELVSELIEQGLVCEQSAEAVGPGRPRVPLAIDPTRRHVVGAAIRPGAVQVCRLNLQGQLLGSVASRAVKSAGRIVPTLKQLLGKLINDQTYAVGLSTPGFFDNQTRRLLFSSAVKSDGSPSLEQLDDVIGDLPFAIENDMHALAARWLQTFQQPDEDVLLVYLEDGQLGAAMLVDGVPNRGCLAGGNEIGHMRLPVDTDDCYCGHSGCLERIASSSFLKRRGSDVTDLTEAILGMNDDGGPVSEMLDLLADGLANAINFMRPNRLVLVSELTRYPQFTQAINARVRSRLLVELAGRVRLDHWDQPQAQSAETAGWLALASVYHPDWIREAAATLAAM